MKNQKYEKVYVKSIDDLPEEDGVYTVKIAEYGMFEEHPFYKDNEQSKREWWDFVIYWYKPIK